MGIDNTERGVSYIAGAIAMVLALILSPHLFKNTWVTTTAKPSKANTCAVGYHLANGVCKKLTLTHPSAWVVQFLEIIIVGGAMIYFAWRRKRAGVAASGLLLGLALGTVGMPFLLVGGWLIVRAFRLQKYGDASFTGSSKRARELSKAKKEGRTVAPLGQKGAPAAPTPSKRYTPKQRPRRR